MIRAHTEGEIAVITLARPDKKNALTPEMLEELVREVSAAAASGARVIVLAGGGDAFCTGFDLSLCRDDPQVLRDLLSGLSRAILTLRTAAAPVVLAAHGAAIAGGCALLGGADIVVTDAEARLGYPVVRLGISPAVSAPFLLQAIGPARARERLLSSSLTSGTEAAAIGLAHECVEKPEEVLPRAMAIARELATKPREGLEATKRWLNTLDGTGDTAAAERGLAASLGLVGSDEERERLAELWKR